MSQDGDVFEGKNLDAAVRNGLDALGLSRAEVTIKILDPGSAGFLGIGSRPCRVQVMRRPGGPPSSDVEESRRRRGSERRRGRRGEGSEGRGPGRDRRERRGEWQGQARAEGGERQGERREARREDERRGEWREERRGERPEERRRDERHEERRGERREPRPAPAPAPREEPVDADAREEGGAEPERHRRRRGRRGGRRRHEGPAPGMTPAGIGLPMEPAEPAENATPAVGPGYEQPAPAAAPEPQRAPRARESGTPERETPSLSADDLAAQGRRLTENLLKAMGFEATVSATVDGNHVEVTAEVAKDEDLLTGRKGEVRQALQHLLNRMLNRGESSRYHLQLEINDFWKRREEELRELARSLADEAVSGGGEVVTEYLNAQERRIVHVTLREDARVKTYALGTGMIKRVAIAPADYDAGPREESE